MLSFGRSEEEGCSNHNNIYIMNGRSQNRAKSCTVVEVGVDLLPAKHAETGFGTALGRDKFLLFEVTVGVLLVLVAVVAFALFQGAVRVGCVGSSGRCWCHLEVLVLL